MGAGDLGSYFIVINAGFVSFLSPCLLPLIPVYFSLISGLSVEEMASGRRSLAGFLPKICAFIIGFTLVFVLLGVGAAYFGKMLQAYRVLFSRVAGFIIVILALNLAGLIRLPLYGGMEYRKTPYPMITSFFVGIAFAVSWSPCIGPVLGSVLLYAAATKTPLEGMFLLFIYSMGLALPFFAAALSLQFFLTLFRRHKKAVRVIQIVSSFFLLIFGILLLTDTLRFLSP